MAHRKLVLAKLNTSTNRLELLMLNIALNYWRSFELTMAHAWSHMIHILTYFLLGHVEFTKPFGAWSSTWSLLWNMDPRRYFETHWFGLQHAYQGCQVRSGKLAARHAAGSRSRISSKHNGGWQRLNVHQIKDLFKAWAHGIPILSNCPQLHIAVCSEESPVTSHSSSKIKPSPSLPTETRRYSFSPSSTAHAAKDLSYPSWKAARCLFKLWLFVVLIRAGTKPRCNNWVFILLKM
jgi:hypothetical protein